MTSSDSGKFDWPRYSASEMIKQSPSTERLSQVTYACDLLLLNYSFKNPVFLSVEWS